MEYLLAPRSLNHTVNLIGCPEETADVETTKNAQTLLWGNRANLHWDLTVNISPDPPLINHGVNLTGGPGEKRENAIFRKP